MQHPKTPIGESTPVLMRSGILRQRMMPYDDVSGAIAEVMQKSPSNFGFGGHSKTALDNWSDADHFGVSQPGPLTIASDSNQRTQPSRTVQHVQPTQPAQPTQRNMPSMGGTSNPSSWNQSGGALQRTMGQEGRSALDANTASLARTMKQEQLKPKMAAWKNMARSGGLSRGPQIDEAGLQAREEQNRVKRMINDPRNWPR